MKRIPVSSEYVGSVLCTSHIQVFNAVSIQEELEYLKQRWF